MNLLLDRVVGQRVVDVDLGADLDGFSVEQGLLIYPLLNGLESGRDQQRDGR